MVDERPEFLDAACAWLENEPSTSVAGTARDGFEAILAVDKLAPDLVLMSAFMSRMDGFEATTAIKRRAKPPIVILLGIHADSSMEIEASAAGADGFLPKSEFASRLLPMLWAFFARLDAAADSEI